MLQRLFPSFFFELQKRYELQKLQALVRRIVRKYQGGKSLRGFDEHVAYVLYRMPATYAAISLVLRRLQESMPTFQPKRLLDLGSGPGTAIVASLKRFSLDTVVAVDRSREFQQLFEMMNPSILAPAVHISWKLWDLASRKRYRDRYDLMTIAYSAGEWTEAMREYWLEWSSSHVKVLVIVEPGTPAGFQTILECRQRLIDLGAQLLAPCPHTLPCPMEQMDAWCHVSVRVPRSTIHRRIKEGELGYEDEKLCYLIALFSHSEKAIVAPSRVVQTPSHRSGHSYLSLCTDQGNYQEIIVSKKEKETYQRAKRCQWGDPFVSVEERSR